MAVQTQRRRFTVEEYYRMAEAGILSEDDRVELIEGEIIEMAGIGTRHAACVNRLNQLLVEQVNRRAVVTVQNPVRLDQYSEPQPDIAVARSRSDFYATAHPTPGEILLIIEVADTTQEYERTVKIPLYARTTIPEVWLVDLQAEILEIFRHPEREGYGERRQVGRGESVSMAALTEVHLSIDDVLGFGPSP